MQELAKSRVEKSVTDAEKIKKEIDYCDVSKPKKADKLDIIMRLYHSCTLKELMSLQNHVIAMRSK